MSFVATQGTPVARPGSSVTPVTETLKFSSSSQTPQTTTQEPAAAAPVPTTEPVKPQDPNFSQRIDSVLAKERAVFKEKQAAKRILAEAAEREAKLTDRLKKIEEFETVKQRNPLEALKLLGLDYSDLTNIYLNQGTPGPEIAVKRVAEELEAMKQSQAQQEQQRLEQARAQQEQELVDVSNQFKETIAEFITKKKSDFEFINLYEGEERQGIINHIYSRIEQYYLDTAAQSPNGVGKVLSIPEGCELVEKEFEDKIFKAAATNKGRQRLQLQPKQDTPQPRTNTQQPRTLSNNLTSNVASVLPAKSEEERMARALAALDRK